MTEENPQPNPPQQPPPTLNYRAGAADIGEISRAQVLAGAVVSAVLLFATVAIAILISIGSKRVKEVSGFILIGAVILGLNIWAIFDYRRGKRRGFAIGIWIGFGVAALVEGLCFATLR